MLVVLSPGSWLHAMPGGEDMMMVDEGLHPGAGLGLCLRTEKVHHAGWLGHGCHAALKGCG